MQQPQNITTYPQVHLEYKEGHVQLHYLPTQKVRSSGQEGFSDRMKSKEWEEARQREEENNYH